jgi:hypothetical protein
MGLRLAGEHTAERPLVVNLLPSAARSRHGPARLRLPWLRRGAAAGGCLLDPRGPCVLSALFVDADARAALDALVTALGAEADARLELALREGVVAGDRASEALIARHALERWIAHSTDRRRRRRALTGAASALLAGAYAVPLCLLGGAPVRLTAGVVLALLTAGSALSLLVSLRRTPTDWPLPQLITGLLCGTGVGIFLTIEGATGRVLVGDEVASLIGLTAMSVSLLIQAVVTRLAA